MEPASGRIVGKLAGLFERTNDFSAPRAGSGLEILLPTAEKAPEKMPIRFKASAVEVPELRMAFRAPASLSDALDATYAKAANDATVLKRARRQRRYAQDR